MRPGPTSVAPATDGTGSDPAPQSHAAPPPAAPPSRSWVTRTVPALLVALALAAYAAYVLLDTGTRQADVRSYALYWALCLVVPGTLVFKAIRGTAGSWLADLGLGATTGLVCELAAWATAESLGLQGQLRFWPVLTLVLLAPRGTRSRIRERPTRPWSLPAFTLVTAACAQVVWQVYRTYLREWPLPPTGRVYYPDLMWHLGLVNEATRSFPLGTPQVVDGGLLVYHWFSDAHIASASLITGVDTTTVLLRLWPLPVLVLGVALTAVLARRVGASDWAAAGAAALMSTTVTVPFWPSMWSGSNHLNPLSPSQVYSAPFTLLLVYALVDLLRARAGSRRAAVVLVVLAALGTSGTKSSALPIVLGGVALATVAALLLRRQRRTLLALLAGLVVVTAAAHELVAGGSFGAGLQLFSALSLTRPYRALHGQTVDFTTRVLAGTTDTPGVGALLLVGLLLIGTLMVLRLLAAFLPLFQRTLRGDLAAWLLSGICLAALVPFLGLGHIGYSEFYFVFGAVPFGCVLAMWSLSTLVQENDPGARVTAVVGACAAVVTLVVGWIRLRSPMGGSRAAVVDDLRSFVIGLTVTALVLLAVVAVGLLRRRRGDARWVPAALAAVVAAVVASGPLNVAVSETAPPASPPRQYALPLAQSTAALWVKRNVPADAVMATNAHCRNAAGASCDSRLWWISGLGGRRVLVEGWGYLPTAVAGFPDQALLRLNQAAFEHPTREAVQQLRDRGVSWLVAQTVPGSKPSADLGRFARERYRKGPIVIYQLPAVP